MIWQISGRALALLTTNVTILCQGYATEVILTLRSVHKSLRVLDAVTHDVDVLRDWLAGAAHPHQRALRATDRRQRRIQKEMREAGRDPPQLTRSGFESMYKSMSELAHLTRNGIEGSGQFSIATRKYPIGPHPDPVVRPTCVNYAGAFVREALVEVGFALSADQVVLVIGTDGRVLGSRGKVLPGVDGLGVAAVEAFGIDDPSQVPVATRASRGTAASCSRPSQGVPAGLARTEGSISGHFSASGSRIRPAENGPSSPTETSTMSERSRAQASA